VHDLRTNCRRIEALLPALSLDADRNGRRILKQISKLRKRAGKVRDMDVLTGYAASVVQPVGEEQCSVRLLEYLGAERQAHSDKLYSVERRYAPKLRKRLKRCSRKLSRMLPEKEKNSSDESALETDVAATALKLTSDLAHPARLDKRNLHPYRLKVKELRNLLQMAEDGNKQEFVARLGEIKDAIGEWHDWQELLSIAIEVIDHGSKCRFVKELRAIGERKYQDALRQSEMMRSRFLGISHNGNHHDSRPKPSASVWSATAALTS
jgi:CHAD domain-containing protein